MRGHQRNAHAYRKVGHVGHQQFVALASRTLHFEVQTIGEGPLEMLGVLSGLFGLFVEQIALDDAQRSARQTKQPFARFGREPLHPNFTAAQILILHPTATEQFAQPEIALVILTIHRQAIRLVPLVGIFVRDPQIAPDDGLDAVGNRVRVKAQTAENIHRVGDAERNAPFLGDRMQDRIQTHDTVGDGVLGMKTQVNELIGHDDSGTFGPEQAMRAPSNLLTQELATRRN